VIRRAVRAILDGGGSPVRIADFGRIVGGNRANAESLLKGLERAHVTWRIYNAKDSQRSDYADAAHPKLYLTDPMLVRASGLDPADYRAELFEAMVGVHLGRAVCEQGTPFWEGLRFNLVDADHEVDFLAVRPDVPAIEAKSGGTGNGPAQLLALQGGGIVATATDFELGDRVWSVPAAYLAAVLKLSS
jgi:predicted AAA+ superfamily ATPase